MESELKQDQNPKRNKASSSTWKYFTVLLEKYNLLQVSPKSAVLPDCLGWPQGQETHW